MKMFLNALAICALFATSFSIAQANDRDPRGWGNRGSGHGSYNGGHYGRRNRYRHGGRRVRYENRRGHGRYGSRRGHNGYHNGSHNGSHCSSYGYCHNGPHSGGHWGGH